MSPRVRLCSVRVRISCLIRVRVRVRVRVRISCLIRVRVRVSSLVFVERNVGGRKLNILVI